MSDHPIYTHTSSHSSGAHNVDHVGTGQTSHHHEDAKGNVSERLERDGQKYVKNSDGTFVNTNTGEVLKDG